MDRLSCCLNYFWLSVISSAMKSDHSFVLGLPCVPGSLAEQLLISLTDLLRALSVIICLLYHLVLVKSSGGHRFLLVNF